MIRIQKILARKEKELQEMICLLKDRISTSPEGSLRISNNQYGCSYYHCISEENGKKNLKNNGVYIRKKNQELAKALAQKSYDKQLLVWMEKCYEQLKTFLQFYDESTLEKFYTQLPKARKCLVHPVVTSMQELVQKWEKIPYEAKHFYEEDTCILTEKGERVRSKSEKILADKFFLKGIPYKYECPLKIQGYGVIYPDFTLMNSITGKIFYWEHLGMMDNADYVEKVMKKLEGYMRNGILPGKQLILTYETRKYGCNTKMIDTLIKAYFEDEYDIE